MKTQLAKKSTHMQPCSNTKYARLPTKFQPSQANLPEFIYELPVNQESALNYISHFTPKNYFYLKQLPSIYTNLKHLDSLSFQASHFP